MIIGIINLFNMLTANRQYNKVVNLVSKSDLVAPVEHNGPSFCAGEKELNTDANENRLTCLYSLPPSSNFIY